MAYNTAYVFACDARGYSQLAGALAVGDGTGSFQYSEQWLQTECAYPLDPANLPLSPKRFRVMNKHGLFGVFRDAAPDDWGTRILLLRHQHAPANELERLLRTSGGGVGGLRFSLSRSRALAPAALPAIEQLHTLAELAQRVESRTQLRPEELALLEPGSSMGGARPKVSVVDEGRPWLVKLGKESDLVDMPLLEFCSMQFLQKKLALDVPETRLIKLANRHAFAVQRFDHHPKGPRHFISANSLFHQDTIRMLKDSRLNPYSYCNLARLISKHCSDYKGDTLELFRRMVANIVMGNTDDHARNHAFIYLINERQWRLSPAYDMLPVVASSSGRQSMGVGLEGASSSLDNALSYANLFGLNKKEAKDIVAEVVDAYRAWPNFCEGLGMRSADLTLVKRVMLGSL